MTTANMTGQRMEFMELTPETAKQFLVHSGLIDERGQLLERELNKNPRRFNKQRADRLADAFRNGMYVCDGNPIRFNPKSEMIDGQHRCYAIWRSGITAPIWVLLGVDDRSRHVIDTGVPRSLRNALESLGEKHVHQLGGAIQNAWKVLTGKNPANLGSHTRITTEEAVRFLEQHPSIRESVSKTRRTSWMPTTVLAAMHYIISREDVRLADEFVEKLTTGDMLSVDDPIHRLRDALIRNQQATKRKFRIEDKFALCILAWNYWIQGRPCRCLKWQAYGPTASPFPKITMPSEVKDTGK